MALCGQRRLRCHHRRPSWSRGLAEGPLAALSPHLLDSVWIQISPLPFHPIPPRPFVDSTATSTVSRPSMTRSLRASASPLPPASSSTLRSVHTPHKCHAGHMHVTNIPTYQHTNRAHARRTAAAASPHHSLEPQPLHSPPPPRPSWQGNTKFIAVALSGGGGPVGIFEHSKPGRVEAGTPTIAGHKSAVLDFDFNPFHEHLIATGG